MFADLSGKGGHVRTVPIPGTIFGCPSIDQRGVPRPQDGNEDGIARCDIGTYEAQPPAFRLGLPTLEPRETTAYSGQHVAYNLTWTVPGPGWRVLDSLHLRIRDEQGVALWGPAFAPGSPNRLETDAARSIWAAASCTVLQDRESG